MFSIPGSFMSGRALPFGTDNKLNTPNKKKEKFKDISPSRLSMLLADSSEEEDNNEQEEEKKQENQKEEEQEQQLNKVVPVIPENTSEIQKLDDKQPIKDYRSIPPEKETSSSILPNDTSDKVLQITQERTDQGKPMGRTSSLSNESEPRSDDAEVFFDTEEKHDDKSHDSVAEQGKVDDLQLVEEVVEVAKNIINATTTTTKTHEPVLVPVPTPVEQPLEAPQKPKRKRKMSEFEFPRHVEELSTLFNYEIAHFNKRRTYNDSMPVFLERLQEDGDAWQENYHKVALQLQRYQTIWNALKARKKELNREKRNR